MNEKIMKAIEEEIDICLEMSKAAKEAGDSAALCVVANAMANLIKVYWTAPYIPVAPQAWSPEERRTGFTT